MMSGVSLKKATIPQELDKLGPNKNGKAVNSRQKRAHLVLKRLDKLTKVFLQSKQVHDMKNQIILMHNWTNEIRASEAKLLTKEQLKLAGKPECHEKWSGVFSKIAFHRFSEKIACTAAAQSIHCHPISFSADRTTEQLALYVRPQEKGAARVLQVTKIGCVTICRQRSNGQERQLIGWCGLKASTDIQSTGRLKARKRC